MRRFAIPAALSWLGLAVALAVVAAAQPSHDVELIASPEAGWPQWRGPRRDAICDEKGLLPCWPVDGPRLLWKTSGLGQGWSCPIIASNRIFITGDEGDRLSLFALDLEGRVLWRAQNGPSWRGPFPGARACFAYRQGRLFQMNAHGRVACLDPTTGAEQWSVNVLERFAGRTNTWAMSECLLVDEGRVIVTPGGAKAFIVALDAKTGATVWTTEPVVLGPSPSPAQMRLAEPAGEIDAASYASPILVKQGRRRLIIGCSLRHAVGVDADSGRLLWTYPMPTTYSVIAATPVLVDDAVFFTAPDLRPGGLLLQLISGNPVQVVRRWRTKLDTCQGGLVYYAGSIFGSWYRNRKGWVCLDAQTGEIRYQLPGLAMGPVLWAEGRLYWLSQGGEMHLLEPTKTGFKVAGRFRLGTGGEHDLWTHPVICQKRLYLRDHDTLFCYNVAAH